MRTFDYNFQQYKRIAAWPSEWAVDIRHAKILHNLLMHNAFKTYAEIGCCAGVSTTAAVESLKQGKGVVVHLCDKTFLPPLLEMTKPWVLSNKIILHREPSVKFLRHNIPLDFAFLDGDHSLKNVKQELKLLLDQNVRNIAAHDTSALERALAQGMPAERFSGPAYLREYLQYEAGWYCLEERRRRPREATVRGFFFATKSKAVFEIARKIFKHWAGAPYTKEYNCRYDPDFKNKPSVRQMQSRKVHSKKHRPVGSHI